MRTGIVSSLEVAADGKRLNGSFFLSEDEKAMRLLRRWKGRKDQIKDLSKPNGVFTGGIFRIVSVTDPVRGRPYVSAKDLVQAEIVPSTYLAPSMGSLLSTLELHEGMILITCSGMNLGKVIWTRRDMSGLCASGDLIRVVPDSQRIVSGYLCAYLSSRFGWASIRKLIYGGHIKHIEPSAVSRIEVPRLSKATERKAHELVEKAARRRVVASANRARAIATAIELISWKGIPEKRLYSKAKAMQLERRMDAFHHSLVVSESRRVLALHAESAPIIDRVVSVFEPNRGARKKVEDPAYGVPFLSSSEVFRLDPQGEYLISRKHTPHLETLLVTKQDLLVPRSGQIGGIIGRAVMPLPTYYEHAASEHLVRIRCQSYDNACYLWAILASEPGYWATVGTAFGSSIPSLDTELVSSLSVPWVKGNQRRTIIQLVSGAITEQDEAIQAERQAVTLVESTIEEAA